MLVPALVLQLFVSNVRGLLHVSTIEHERRPECYPISPFLLPRFAASHIRSRSAPEVNFYLFPLGPRGRA